MSHAQRSGPRETAPLLAPLYGASLPVAVSRFFNKYAIFSGRASRSEYWWLAVVYAGVCVILEAIMNVFTDRTAAGGSVSQPAAHFALFVLVILTLAMFIPFLALTVRRLHDINLSGWVILLTFVPIIGTLAMLLFSILPPVAQGQRFDAPGTDPPQPATR